jgi:PIN domain nuclease of toxin-antitoxin system
LKLLLDTHAVIWWQRDDRRLGRAARNAIATADVVYVSAATGIEAAIKIAQGRMRLEESFRVLIAADDFTELAMTLKHAQELERLPMHHKDPLDRMLVAQARVEGLTLVTHDRVLEKYGVPIIWT